MARQRLAEAPPSGQPTGKKLPASCDRGEKRPLTSLESAGARSPAPQFYRRVSGPTATPQEGVAEVAVYPQAAPAAFREPRTAKLYWIQSSRAMLREGAGHRRRSPAPRPRTAAPRRAGRCRSLPRRRAPLSGARRWREARLVGCAGRRGGPGRWQGSGRGAAPVDCALPRRQRRARADTRAGRCNAWPYSALAAP